MKKYIFLSQNLDNSNFCRIFANDFKSEFFGAKIKPFFMFKQYKKYPMSVHWGPIQHPLSIHCNLEAGSIEN